MRYSNDEGMGQGDFFKEVQTSPLSAGGSACGRRRVLSCTA